MSNNFKRGEWMTVDFSPTAPSYHLEMFSTIFSTAVCEAEPWPRPLEPPAARSALCFCTKAGIVFYCRMAEGRPRRSTAGRRRNDDAFVESSEANIRAAMANLASYAEHSRRREVSCGGTRLLLDRHCCCRSDR